MDRVFLDANVLFSAAYRPDAGLRKLWSLPKVELITSTQAREETRRNLTEPDQQKRLDPLLASVTVVPEAPDPASYLLARLR